MLQQETYYSSGIMNWVSGFLGRRASNPQSLHCGFSESRQTMEDEVSLTSSRNNRRIIGQHSLDQSSFDRFREYKKNPKRRWNLQPDFIFPDMIGSSDILTNDEIVFLDEEKPDRLVGCTWELVFSTEAHGYLLSTLYRNLKSWTGPTLLVVKDKHGHRFGAFVTESFKPDDKIHGGGECFVFRLKHENLKLLFSDNAELSSASVNDHNIPESHTQANRKNEKIFSAKLDQKTTDELLVNEEHFSSEGLIGNSEKSTPLTYSSISNKPSDIKDNTQLFGNKKLLEATAKDRKDIQDDCYEQKQKDFLKDHDLSEHYIWAWAGENSCFIHGDDQLLQIGLDDGKVALNIDNMLEKGRSEATRVFDNAPLAPSLSNKDGDFEIVALEVWLFKQL